MHVSIQDGNAQLLLGDELIAEGQRALWTTAAVYHASFEQSQEAARKSPAFHEHPFPTCFVCGPQRTEGDGLRIFPGELPGKTGEHIFAAPWIPATEFADPKGRIREEFLWAAMDCPTGFAAGFPYEGKLVTGRLAVEVVGRVHADEKCVLLSWRTAVDGRKHHASAVLTGEDGSVRAHARATWIKLG